MGSRTFLFPCDKLVLFKKQKQKQTSFWKFTENFQIQLNGSPNWRIPIPSHPSPYWSASFTEMVAIPYGAENGTDGLQGTVPSKTIFTEFQLPSSGNWLYFGVLNCHMTLYNIPKSPSLPLETKKKKKKWKARFVTTFASVNLASPSTHQILR